MTDGSDAGAGAGAEPHAESDAEPDAESPPQSPREPPPVEIPIEDHLDLHPFRPRDIPDVVRSYLEAARERGFDEVRLIHGKGTGFQRERVREVLAAIEWVVDVRDAPIGRGHWGSTLCRLVRHD